MPYSYSVYTGNGTNDQFAVSFSYIRKEHVFASVNYVNATFTWVNSGTIQLDSVPANAARVEVRRVTPVANPLVDFTDGSTLVAADLDTVTLQQTYINQEQDDQFQDAVFINSQGLLDAGGKRITNVGGPVNAQDVATKTYVDTTTVASAGDAMTGPLAMGNNKITGLGTTSSPSDAASKQYVDDNALLYSGSPGFTQDGTGAVTRSWSSKLKDVVSVKDFGAVGDGVTDDAAAINAALALGCSVAWTQHHAIGAPLVFQDGSQLIAGPDAEITNINAGSGLVFNMSGRTGAKVIGGKVNGNWPAVSGTVCVDLHNATSCELIGVSFFDVASTVNGSVALLGGVSCKVSDCTFTDVEGSAITLRDNATFTQSSVKNEITGNVFNDRAGFGVLLRSGSKDNLIARNRGYSGGIEIIGLQFGAEYNRIAGNHCEGSIDNGISVSGDYNVVVGNICKYNARAGIHLWGSFNTVTGNQCIGNDTGAGATIWAGIGMSANYGGCGQYNMIAGNICDDDQAVPTQRNSIRFAGLGYSAWAAGQSINTAPGNVYRLNGLNVYIATTSGTTGASAPVHTTGTVSDGGVSWRYVSTFFNAAQPNNNRAFENQLVRVAAGGNQIVDATPGGTNWWSTSQQGWLPNNLNVLGSLTLNSSPVYARSNVLGSVSQLGGVPTGAIIERGSGATGEWVRYADGLQIVTKTDITGTGINAADGALFKSPTDITFTLSPPFVAAPVLLNGQTTDADTWVTPVSATTGQGTVRLRSTVSKSGAVNYSMTAIGRWY